MNMTIRAAIKFYTERKCSVSKMEYLDVVFATSLCIIIPLNNGVRIFVDTHPEMEYLKEKYPLEIPNKNGIFKRISFEILDDREPIIPECIRKYISNSSCNEVLYYADTVKERVINEFISYNGGIDIEKFTKNVVELWQ